MPSFHSVIKAKVSYQTYVEEIFDKILLLILMACISILHNVEEMSKMSKLITFFLPVDGFHVQIPNHLAEV